MTNNLFEVLKHNMWGRQSQKYLSLRKIVNDETIHISYEETSLIPNI